MIKNCKNQFRIQHEIIHFRHSLHLMQLKSQVVVRNLGQNFFVQTFDFCSKRFSVTFLVFEKKNFSNKNTKKISTKKNCKKSKKKLKKMENKERKYLTKKVQKNQQKNEFLKIEFPTNKIENFLQKNIEKIQKNTYFCWFLFPKKITNF